MEDGDGDRQEKEGVIEDNPSDMAPSIITNNETALETQEEATNDVPPAL